MEHIELLEQQHQEMQDLMQANQTRMEALLTGIKDAIPAAAANDNRRGRCRIQSKALPSTTATGGKGYKK